MKNRLVPILLLLAAFVMAPQAGRSQNCEVTLPWSENFDSYTTEGGTTMPTCWNRLVGFQVNATTVRPNFWIFTSGTHGTVLNFNGQGSGNGVMKIASPRIPAQLNHLEISFEVTGSGLMIYAVTDTTDLATYHLIGTFNSPSMYSWTSYELHTDTVNGIPADTGFLVFAAAYGSTGYSTSRLDNLMVTALNPCNRPTQVNIERVGVTSAAISWPAVDGAQGYTVYYNTDDDFANASSDYVTGVGTTLTDLEAATHYYVWVTTDCGDGLASDPRGADFTTQFSCYSLVNLNQTDANHEAAAFQWEYDVRGNEADGVIVTLRDLSDPSASAVEEMSTGSTYHFFTGLDYTHQYEAEFRALCGADTSEVIVRPIVFRNCGETVLAADSTSWSNEYPLNPFYNHTYSQMVYPASVLHDMDTIRAIAIRRHVRASSLATSRTLSIWLGNTTNTASSSPVSVTGMTQVANGVGYNLPNQEWDTLMFTTPFIYDGTSNVVVTIVDNTGSHVSSAAAPHWLYHESEWQVHYVADDNTTYNAANPPSSVSHRMTLPDLRFVGLCNDENICEAPVLAVIDVDSMTAEVDWVAGGNSPWTLQYRPLGGTWITENNVTYSPFTLSNLTPDTRYEVRVGVDCNGQMRYSRPVNFLTDCAFQHIPFHFTQNDMVVAAQEGFTHCWSFSQYIKRGRLSDSHRGYLRNIGNGEWLMLPAVAEPLQGAKLRTWVGSSDQGFFKVGVASLDDCSDVEWIDTVEVPANNPNTSHEEFISYLDLYTGTGTRVVISPIVNNAFHYMYFFDFHIEPIEGCRPPVRLTLDEADSSSLTFHWTAVGSATSWAVFVDGVQVGTATGTPSFTATGLNPYTEYEVSVRSLCAEGDTSDAAIATFLTGCAGVSCSFTINGASSAGDGWHGGFIEVTSGNRVIGRVKMLRGSTVSETFMICGGMPLNFRWYSGNDDDICSFTVVDEAGEVLYQISDASLLDSTFLVLDSLCGEQGGEPPVRIDDVDGSHVTLSPNPASSTVTLTGLESGDEVVLMDLSGRELQTIKQSDSQATVLDVSSLVRGAYFVRIVGENRLITRRLIVY